MNPPLTYNDIIYVKVRGTVLVTKDSKDFDGEIPFKIIGYSFIDKHYILQVPKYYNIKNVWNIKDSDIADFNIPDKYKNKYAIAVRFDKISKIDSKSTNQDGMFCSFCKIFCYMAESNQDDGDFICYKCRQNPYRH